ncbi:hypothetical protein [Robiginitalea marina]|uniref:DNA-directed RNA polymerase n=1 Tax=Robiginitalea marina TaxID=2954105 RepID=A0ABT1AZY8_9FLAO|nr:hypothetical protein [Robiginitalea marina]MCO5725552.1 hypothetical protein [Robiginitalea marina]
MKTINKNNEAINVYLPNKLFKDLKVAIEERKTRGEEPKLQLAQAAYFANLVVYLPFTKKDQYEDKYGWVSLCSEILNSIGNYSDYMDFLVEREILERHPKNYSTISRKCYRYRLAERYRNHVITRVPVESHKSFVKARNMELEERKRRAEESTPHLTKWLDPNKFDVDYEAAMAYIRKEYQGEAFLGKKNKRIIAIESLKAKDWGYSREGKDDRLHSLITRLPKDLKKFVTYSDFGPLQSLDLKSSQPFIFSSIIQNQIINKTTLPKNKITKHFYKPTIPSTMLEQNDRINDLGALQGFVYEVLCGKFYENYGQILYEEGVLMKKVDQSFYYHGTTDKGKEMMDYKTLRDAGKNLIMRTFFSHYENRHNYVRVFEKHYPEPFAVMQLIKESKPDEKNYFSLLLQNIEADFILNYATRIIAEKHPEIPLFTIHDSVITPEVYLAVVEQEFRQHLQNYFSLSPQLSLESWCKDCEVAA